MIGGVLTFAKGHGTGNDFVILPDPDGALRLSPRLVAALCDRHRGIGADGVLRVVRSAGHPDAAGQPAEWFMDYWNADGSAAEMCGNGVRVYARYLVDTGLAPAGALAIATRSGVVAVQVGPDEVAARLRAPRVYGHSTTRVGGDRYSGASVDVGNPHLVCTLSDGLRELVALDLSTSPEVSDVDFPAGVNVEFFAAAPVVSGCDAHVRMRVYERGSGETLSCGTGACAVATVVLRGIGRDTGTVIVDVPGGRLRITVEPDGCWLAGPAVIVATGAVTRAALGVALPAASPTPA